MDDQQLWNLGNARLADLLVNLADDAEPALKQMLTSYRNTKEAITAVIADVDAASACRECGGQCCLNGKYRINVFDAVASTRAQIPTSANFCQKPLCPYGTDGGCTMEPGLRPADCVLFICDAIDQKLSPQARLLLAGQEDVLRKCIRNASGLTGEQMGTPLLLWAAKLSNESKSKV